MKICIADDDLASRTVLQAILSKWDYEVISAADGTEAMAVMTGKEAPSLAILDWIMPGMDGVTLCQKLRGLDKEKFVYIILLTSKSEKEDIVRGLEAGADDYIVKPFDNFELKARVNGGRRMIEMQEKFREREKLKGVLEMAGAVCHELNQPLQSVSGFSELLLMDAKKEDPNYEMLNNIKGGIERIGRLTHKIMKITRYQSKPYVGKTRIVDIDSASTEEY